MGMPGIAKFFSTHKCNGVCKQLGLLPFQYPEEQAEQRPRPSDLAREESCESNHSEHSARGELDELRSQVASALDNRGRAARRRSSLGGLADELSSLSAGFARGKTRRGRLSSMWSNGKAFGKALISAVANSVHSPATSRSVSPVASAGRNDGADGCVSPLAPPAAYRRRRPSVEGSSPLVGLR
jgi:hypothetical protein